MPLKENCNEYDHINQREQCTGKTYMAQQLLERYHAPYLSIDHLKWAYTERI